MVKTSFLSSNITNIEWSEGFCTCSDSLSTDCDDFGEICGSMNVKPPKFFKHFGLTTWTDFTVTILIGAISFMAILSIILLIRDVSLLSKLFNSKKPYFGTYH